MTTTDDALDTIRKALKGNEPSELVKEIRALRAEIARLTGKVEALERRPQTVPYVPYQPYVPYVPPVLPRPVYPPYPWMTPTYFQITSSETATVVNPKGPTITATSHVTLDAKDVEGFRRAADFVQRLESGRDTVIGGSR